MVTVSDILDALPPGCSHAVIDPSGLERTVTGPATLAEATDANLVYVKHEGSRGAAAVASTQSAVMVVPSALDVDPSSASAVALVIADNPRLTYIRLVSKLFVPDSPPSIHPSAVISDNATVHPTASVGPGCTIGDARVGARCVIHAGVHVYDGVTVGEDVVIHAGVTIGSDGFGFERDEDGVPTKFPHLGGVVIEDRVEIGANSTVDRGTLGNTVIEHDAKTDNLVHVAHNVRVGVGSLLAAGAVIAGSTVLGKNVWIGPSACISNGLEIGDAAFVSLGAVVTRDVPAGGRVTGNFAVDHARFLRHLRSLG